MALSIIFKKCFSFLLFSLKIPHTKISKLAECNNLILMYHKIIPSQSARSEGVQAGMYVTPESFKLQVIFLKKYFNVIDLSEYFIKNSQYEKDCKIPYCTITFDDGWQDFYRYAYPILKENNLPATVFLATNYIDTSKWFWTDRIAHLLKHKNQKTNGQSPDEKINLIENQKGNFEAQLESSITILKKLRTEEIENILDELEQRWNVNKAETDRHFLSWEEVVEMKNSGLITFGSHTVNHSILTTLNPYEVEVELKESMGTLLSKGVVNPSFVPFCYPNGNHNENIVRQVRQAGYHMAVTTRNGWSEKGSDPFTLKRIGIHNDMTSTEAMFACKIAKII